jgi:hypothetical protein
MTSCQSRPLPSFSRFSPYAFFGVHILLSIHPSSV